MPFIITLDSFNRHASSTSASDLKIRLKDCPNVKAVKFKKLILPFTWYPIDSTNNTLSINDGTGNVVATILTPTTWSATDIASALKTALDLASDPSANLTFTVTYNSGTKKFTIAATGNFTLKFATSANTLYRILGFNNVDTYTGAATYTGDNVSQVTGPEYVVVRSSALATNTKESPLAYYDDQTIANDKFITANKAVFVIIPINVGQGSTIIYTEAEIEKRIDYMTSAGLATKILQDIDLKLENPWTGDAFNINGATWMLELEAEK